MSRIPVWAMMATPFDANAERICERSLRALTEESLTRGCSGIIALGVIAEPDSLSPAEKSQALGVILDSAGPAPVIAAIMNRNPADAAKELAVLTDEFGGRLHAVMVPVLSPDPVELRRALATTHSITNLPVLLQDLPAATGVTIAIDHLQQAVTGLDFLYGIKCECPPTFWRIRRLREVTEVHLMAGFGGLGLVDDVLAGADTVAAGVSVPEVLVDAVDLLAAGEVGAAQGVIGRAAGLINFETQARTSIAIRKEHWHRQGVIAHSTVRPPSLPYLAEFDEHSRDHGFPAPSPGN
ncbi:dihydrodipicolinate synthase family protein [Rhodococcus oxybenzonivorans]|uniref:dihydrodipicolinate synthase family protein n=1 Tax=Rhodococcus TaxID=1827 RepID=UPI001359D484|nr:MULTISPECIES: dihydrodipicolinate synthase family protein [Rhodococcus]MDV7356004.1 dihydrodipicolinate synthase family protein [Rhodococcus oxybenzonivorans]